MNGIYSLLYNSINSTARADSIYFAKKVTQMYDLVG